jgi:hypothetical protein
MFNPFFGFGLIRNTTFRMLWNFFPSLIPKLKHWDVCNAQKKKRLPLEFPRRHFKDCFPASESDYKHDARK